MKTGLKALSLFSIFSLSQILAGCNSTVQPGTLGVGTGGTNLSPLSPAADAAGILLGDKAYDSSGNVLIGTMPLGTNVTGANGVLATAVPQGYYDGTQTLTAEDASLVAANIISGATIFGVNGSATQAYSSCSDNALNAGQCSTAASRYVATAAGSNVSGANASLSMAIPQGYYSGSQTASASDTNLVASNIASGVSIFGISGSATLAPATCTSNGQSGCVANASFLAGAPASANFNAANGTRVITPPAGYYDGATKTVTANDTNLVAGKILSGTTIFGVSGSATQAYSSCSDNALNASQCSTAASRYVATAAGSNVTGANGSLSATIPQGYYSGSQTATASDTNLVASNLISTATIFGVTGSVTACNGSNQTGCVSSATFPTQSTPTTPAAAGNVLTGDQFYAGGAMQTGTMANNGSPTFTPSTTPQTLSVGYYSGGTVQGDANLVATKILSGTTIFGVAGSATQAYSSCSDNALNAGQCSTAASRYVATAAGSNVSGANGSLSATIPQGYYSGSQTATASDTNLVAGKILSGTTIFGVAGSATQAYSSCSDNALNAGQCSTAASRYVATAAGSNVSGANASLSMTIPQGYYSGTQIATASDTNLIASNLISTATIFGVTGSVTACNGSNQAGCVSSATFPTQSTPTTPAAVGNVLTGKQFYAGGAIQTGTMANQGFPTYTPGTSAQTLTAGYYSGGTVQGDANLVATKILSGTTIFGVSGSATQAYSSCSDNALNASQCSTAASRYVATAAGSNVNGANGSLSATIPQGYYSGSQTATASDTNLVAGKILSGTTIFGVSGSATQAYSSCSDNALNASQCSTAASRYVATAAGSNVSGANGSLSATIPQGYYSGSQTATASDTNLVASKILSGTTIFGVSGSATQAYSSCSDNALNAGQCSTAASRYVATAAGSNVSGANGSLSATIPRGYYSGAQTATASDTNLVASNLISTATIFGVTGSVTACNGSNQTGCVSSATFPTQSTPTTPAAAANVLTGKQFYAGGGQLTGTMANQGSPTYTPGTSAQTLTAGYYSGGTVQGDANLVASNIASGVSIFGVSGSATLAPANCSSNGQTNCVANASYLAGAPAAANSNAANGVLVITPPAGYYDGSTKTVTASDTHLVAGNIIAGNTIFGVAGSVTNYGNPNFASAWSGAGYYGGSPTNLPSASEIVSGNTILGVAGSASAAIFAALTGSNASRTLGTTQITEYAEVNTYGSTTLPAGYRDVPKIAIDDDGYTGGSVTYATRPSVICGTTQTTVAARISACATANGSSATYNGATNGNAGQGTWNLVTYANSSNAQYAGHHAEVWQDSQTGLLWSSLVATSNNWCLASGNAESTDPSNYCNSATYQPHYPSAESDCAETSTIPAIAAEATGGTLGNAWSGTYVAAKGAMGAQSSASSPSVYWRLPTIYDYEQANIDGIRFVMPDMGTNSDGYEWSASVFSSSRGFAWAFYSSYGYVANNSRTLTYPVRCVGR